MSAVKSGAEPLTIVFKDDGLVPNNPMPFLVYKGAVNVGKDPEATIEQLFGSNGWGAMWRNGVYDFAHYHATVHEVLGVARGYARVQFGGAHGRALEIAAGDVAIPPPVPGINACRRAMISRWSAPIRRARRWICNGRRRRTTRRR